MKLTNQTIFWKCWLWSVITGGVVATLFWTICNIGGFFRGDEGGTIFVTILLILSIVGSYAGAGVVGWRITEKYYTRTVDRFVKRYTLYSLGSFVLLVGIVYSPVSILALLWSLLAPLCVIIAINRTRKAT